MEFGMYSRSYSSKILYERSLTYENGAVSKYFEFESRTFVPPPEIRKHNNILDIWYIEKWDEVTDRRIIKTAILDRIYKQKKMIEDTMEILNDLENYYKLLDDEFNDYVIEVIKF